MGGGLEAWERRIEDRNVKCGEEKCGVVSGLVNEWGVWDGRGKWGGGGVVLPCYRVGEKLGNSFLSPYP